MVITLISATLLRLIFNDRVAEIELLQSAGEKLSFYLEPMCFHKVIGRQPKVISVVWEECSLWRVWGAAEEPSPLFLAAAIRRGGCTQIVIKRSLMNPWCIVAVHVCVCERRQCWSCSITLDAQQRWRQGGGKQSDELPFALFRVMGSLPSGGLLHATHIMQNWLLRLLLVLAAEKQLQCKDRCSFNDSPHITV